MNETDKERAAALLAEARVMLRGADDYDALVVCERALSLVQEAHAIITGDSEATEYNVHGGVYDDPDYIVYPDG